MNQKNRFTFVLHQGSIHHASAMGRHDDKVPVTSAIRFLRQHDITFEPHFYTYEEHGGTHHAAKSLGVPEHAVIKTLILETELRQPLVVLMHGDCEVSAKELARVIGANRVNPCDEHSAQKHTGYLVGGISPFGTRSPLTVYMEDTILEIPLVFVNGGKRGFLVSLNPKDIRSSISAIPVHVAQPVIDPL